MGLIIGSFEVIVPHRIGEITQNILRAMIVGTVASYLTACFAGKADILFAIQIENELYIIELHNGTKTSDIGLQLLPSLLFLLYNYSLNHLHFQVYFLKRI